MYGECQSRVAVLRDGAAANAIHEVLADLPSRASMRPPLFGRERVANASAWRMHGGENLSPWTKRGIVLVAIAAPIVLVGIVVWQIMEGDI